jgi:hypothetical protein
MGGVRFLSDLRVADQIKAVPGQGSKLVEIRVYVSYRRKGVIAAVLGALVMRQTS